jgi:hypothetical protein
MERFAFAYFANGWNEALSWPLTVSLHALERHGGAAARYPRYLVYSGVLPAELPELCRSHNLILQQEAPLTTRRALPNKALLCRVPEHPVVCLMDLDTVLLRDPTPMFEQVAAEGVVRSRRELIPPYTFWPKLPVVVGRWLRRGLGYSVWHGQFRRFAPGAKVEPLPSLHPAEERMLPYFNTGVNFVPGRHLRSLGEAWWHTCSCILNDARFRRPYTKLFIPHFYEQMSYAIGLHRAGIPWRELPAEFNLLPTDLAAPADHEITDPTIVHLVSPVRHWLSPNAPGPDPEIFVPIYRQVRELALEAAAGPKLQLQHR